jgi:hypothetical protein
MNAFESSELYNYQEQPHQSAQPPCTRTRAHVATAAALVALPSLSTRSRAHQSGVTPPAHIPGFAAAVMRQQWHQCGIVCLTCHITHLENEVHQAITVMNADMGKLSSIQAVNEKHEVQETMEPIVGQ